MSANFAVQSLLNDIKHVCGMMEEFADVCPDEVWTSLFGGFPVWQNYYHALEAISFFLGNAADTPEPIYGHEIAMFTASPATPPTREALKARAKTIHAVWIASVEKLTDADLVAEHPALTAYLKRPVAVVSAISGAIAHHYYHFGQSDAALRHNGLRGLY